MIKIKTDRFVTMCIANCLQKLWLVQVCGFLSVTRQANFYFSNVSNVGKS